MPTALESISLRLWTVSPLWFSILSMISCPRMWNCRSSDSQSHCCRSNIRQTRRNRPAIRALFLRSMISNNPLAMRTAFYHKSLLIIKCMVFVISINKTLTASYLQFKRQIQIHVQSCAMIYHVQKLKPIQFSLKEVILS